MYSSRFLAAILALVCSSAAAEEIHNEPENAHEVRSPRREYEQAIHAAGQEYVRAVQRARRQSIERLDKAMREATRAGDLDRALALRREKQQHEAHANVVPNPIAVIAPEERLQQKLRLEPTPAVPLSTETLTIHPWYVFHRTPAGHAVPVKVIKLEPDGKLRFLEGADSSAWDEKQPTWKYEDGHLLLPAKTGVLAAFEATNTTILRSREEAPHRFFWIQQEISDPLQAAAKGSANPN
ncbi:MAG: hypothetical protein KY476_18470 [Planctomycetes bacterium]|nr:hypothetical protein [Planctomycetota bacterium]